MKIGDEVRLAWDACGDLPPSYIRRKGVIISENQQHTESNGGRVVKAFNVKLSKRKKHFVLWEDELELING